MEQVYVFNRTHEKSDYWLYDNCNWNLKRSEYHPKRGPKQTIMKEYHLVANTTDGKFMKRYVSCLVHQNINTGQISEVGNYVVVRYLGNYDMANYKHPKHGNTVEPKQNRKHKIQKS